MLSRCKMIVSVLGAVAAVASGCGGQVALAANAPSAGRVPGSPLAVTDRSHVVLLEYEAWFGPNAVTFQLAEAMPLLQSADMQSLGGGYDSADPHVIKQHVEWMQYMG